MSKIVNLKTCAKTLVMLSVIAAPVAQAVAQANKVPAEVIARRLANKKAKQQTPSVAAKKAKAAGVQLYGYVSMSDERDPGLYKFSSNNAASKVSSTATCSAITLLHTCKALICLHGMRRPTRRLSSLSTSTSTTPVHGR